MEKTKHTYQEVEQFLQNPDTAHMVFEEETKYVHVAMAYTGNIRWAWGSNSTYKDISYFSESQREFMQNATFTYSPMGI
jgi:hypothetical protein